MVSEYGIGLSIAFGLMAVIWFVFVVPSERRYHEQKLRLLQERIRKRQADVEQESMDNLKDVHASAVSSDDDPS